MNLQGYTHGDIDRLVGVLDLDPDEIAASDEQIRTLDDTGASHYARTLSLDEAPVACFGVWPLGGHRGYAWSILTYEAVQHPKALYSSVRRSLVAFERDEGLKRIEAVGLVSNPRLGSWFKHLGFQRETVDGGMSGYGPNGESYHLYARVRGF